MIEAGRSKINQLDKKLTKTKDEARRKLKEQEIKIQNINLILKKSADTVYIKNILIKYLTTNDQSVLLPVLNLF